MAANKKKKKKVTAGRSELDAEKEKEMFEDVAHTIS